MKKQPKSLVNRLGVAKFDLHEAYIEAELLEIVDPKLPHAAKLRLHYTTKAIEKAETGVAVAVQAIKEMRIIQKLYREAVKAKKRLKK